MGARSVALLVGAITATRLTIPPTAALTAAERPMAEAVETSWYLIPADLAPQRRLARLADTLDPRFYRRLADTDHDGLPNLLVALPGRGNGSWDVGMARMLLFRGADLVAGRLEAHRLTKSGLFPRLERLADVTGDGRPELIVKTMPSGSGQVSDWLVYHWTGRAYDLIFDHALDHWRGDNWIQFEPGRITFSCRPWRRYEHKFDPHRVHQEVWVLRDGRFRFGQHVMPPPATIRQAVIDAEDSFRRQDYAAALPGYRKALLLPPERVDLPGQAFRDRDWLPYVHLRIGQTLALLERTAEAQTELRAAAAAGGYVGEAAATFQQRLAVGLPEALAALLRMPPEPHDPQIPPMAHLQAADLAPPEVTLQAYLTRNPETAVVDLLTASGQEVPRPHLAVDLDGDGRQEIWGMIGYESYLGVQTEQGWRVTALGQWTRTPEPRCKSDD